MSGETQFLPLPSGERIAYNHTKGNKQTGLMFIHGFLSDKEGGKALAIEDWCKVNDRSCVRFDCLGHGQSSGEFKDCTIGGWAENVLSVIDEVVEQDKKYVLVGSSMGGWLMLLAALARPERVAGLVGIAAAPDFTEDIVKNELSDEQLKEMEETGMTHLPNDYEGAPDYPITKKLIEEGRNNLLLQDVIDVHCPVRLLQGFDDASVPWKTAVKISQMLATDDVDVVLAKGGDHRLSRPVDIHRMLNTIGDLLSLIEKTEC
ncbi:MAG: alpha/beta hydrolase [Alphaproteobacteria bacterium]|nr:alpha/beta hydrolase [Alphaproteobacteria bacterium]